jgi:hypothetical protein
VFADIGGDRALAALVRLVPWVLGALQPQLLVVKSEELAAAAEAQLARQRQQRQQQQQQQQQQQLDARQAQQQVCQDLGRLQLQAQPQHQQPVERSASASCDKVAASVDAASTITDPVAWWQQLEQQVGVPTPAAPAGGAARPCGAAPEPWFLEARAGGFRKHPLQYPQRSTHGGVRICRPHSYDAAKGCLKREQCPFDHIHCHHCLEPHHRAVDCPLH